MLILVSDGIANVPLTQPLTPRAGRGLLSYAQTDVMDVTRLLHRDGVRLVVINTDHRENELLIKEEGLTVPTAARWYRPTEFLMELADAAKGSYYGLGLTTESKPIKGDKLENWFYFDYGQKK